jgi:hypothetical protein
MLHSHALEVIRIVLLEKAGLCGDSVEALTRVPL